MVLWTSILGPYLPSKTFSACLESQPSHLVVLIKQFHSVLESDLHLGEVKVEMTLEGANLDAPTPIGGEAMVKEDFLDLPIQKIPRHSDQQNSWSLIFPSKHISEKHQYLGWGRRVMALNGL